MGDPNRCGECGLLLCACPEGPLEPDDPVYYQGEEISDGWATYAPVVTFSVCLQKGCS
jgi:hypothetical protein